MPDSTQTTETTANKPEKPTSQSPEYYDEYDFDIDNRPLQPYTPSKEDGWKRLGEGVYRKQIDPAE